MFAMSSRKSKLKPLLIGLALLALAGAAMAQAVGAADRVVLLQAKRFEGTFKLAAGEMALKFGEATGDWKITSGETKLAAALEPKPGKPDRATLSLDGRTVEGTATVEGKTLTLEFKDGKTAYVFKLTLSGRNEGEIKVTKNDATLVASAFKRA